MDNEKIPQQWKQGEIAPVYKKESALNKSSYRPLSILPSLSKVFERIMNIRMSLHLETMYHKYVFAYRKHHGCDTALLSLTEEWRKELDNHKVIGLVSMDLSKAFDTLPHYLIVSKLQQYGGDQKTSALIEDCLSNRKQRVKYRNSYSTWQNITAIQRPSGIHIGPLLFNMFMNDLAYVGVNQSKLSAYADDRQIVHASQDPVKVQGTINSDLAKAENGMKRNYTKYQAIVMGKCEIKCEM